MIVTAELARVPYSSPRMNTGATRRSNSMSLPRCGSIVIARHGFVGEQLQQIVRGVVAADEIIQRPLAGDDFWPRRAVEVRIRETVDAGWQHACACALRFDV